jgi:hypothetical protein
MTRTSASRELEDLKRRQQELQAMERARKARKAHSATQDGELLGGTEGTYRSGFDPELLDRPQAVELPAASPRRRSKPRTRRSAAVADACTPGLAPERRR